MGDYNGQSWVSNPILSINVEVRGEKKHCTMNANDTTSFSITYECETISDPNTMLVLDALSFELQDTTPLNVAEPTPIPNFEPVICGPSHESFICREVLSTEISHSYTLAINAGLSVTASVGASVEVGEMLFGIDEKTTFTTQLSATTSFSIDNSWTSGHRTEEDTIVQVEVPSNTEVTINIMRTKEDIEYKWKAVFELLGMYSAKWMNGHEQTEDVTTVLSGLHRELYAFGRWNYPGTDFLRVIITDNYGNTMVGCDHDILNLEHNHSRSCNITNDSVTNYNLGTHI